MKNSTNAIQEIDSNEALVQTEKRRCPNCGAELGGGAFCEDCGTPVALSVADKKACPGCNSSVSNTSFCEDCGTLLTFNECPCCKKNTLGDFCENCGIAVSSRAIEVQRTFKKRQELPVSSITISLSDAAQQLVKEARKVAERQRQREILLKEKRHFEEREKRIEETSDWNTGKFMSGREEQAVIARDFLARTRNLQKERESGGVEAESLLKRETIEFQNLRAKGHHFCGEWVAKGNDFLSILKILSKGENLEIVEYWHCDNWWDAVIECSAARNGDDLCFESLSWNVLNAHDSVHRPANRRVIGGMVFHGHIAKNGLIMSGHAMYWSGRRQFRTYIKQEFGTAQL